MTYSISVRVAIRGTTEFAKTHKSRKPRFLTSMIVLYCRSRVTVLEMFLVEI